MGAWAVVLAAGAGQRFGGRKQFAVAAGRRLVDLALAAVRPAVDGVVLVLPAGGAWDGPPVDVVVAGGAARPDSARAGLAAVPGGAAHVVVHDAAHPLASAALCRAVLQGVRGGADGAVPALALADTPLRVSGAVVRSIEDRRGLVLDQLPQAFDAAALRRAYERWPDAPYEVPAVLAGGGRIVVVPGEPGNVHVTTAADLAVVAALLRARQG